MKKEYRLPLCIIYKLINSINGKVYIGQTWRSLSKRSNSTGSGYRGCTSLWNAIKKYKWINFYYEIITFASTQESADLLERQFIEQYKSNIKKYGYNLKDGGNLNSTYSESSRKKQSEKAKLKTGIKNPFFGKKHTEKTKQKISNANKGKASRSGAVLSDETKSKISDTLTGRQLSEETRKKMSLAQIGKPGTMTGKKHSEETRKKMSERRKGKTWKLVNGKRVWGDK